MKQKIKVITVSILAVCAIVFVILSGSSSTFSATTTTYADVYGWAWSPNIGWISFSSNNSSGSSPTPTPTATPTGVSFQVKIKGILSNKKGAFEGYAWSPNIGWISFNSADVVSGGCTTTPDGIATIQDFKTGEISGWAIALAGKGRTDGWDGCIELAGTNHSSLSTATADINGKTYRTGGIKYDPVTSTIKGFAWGSSVVGWLNFDTGLNSVRCAGCKNISVASFTPTCSISSQSPNTTNGTNNVSFSSTVTPAGTYSYAWYPMGGSVKLETTGSTASYLYTNTGTTNLVYSPLLSVTDTVNDPTNPKQVACGSVTVPPAPAASLNLYLVPNSNPTATVLSSAKALPSTNVVSIRRGTVALLGLDAPGYSGCLPFNAGGLNSWNSIFPSQDVQDLISTNLEGGSYVSVDTSVLDPNTTYTARIICANSTTGNNDYDFVNFKITSSSLKEF